LVGTAGRVADSVAAGSAEGAGWAAGLVVAGWAAGLVVADLAAAKVAEGWVVAKVEAGSEEEVEEVVGLVVAEGRAGTLAPTPAAGWWSCMRQK
jgi:hypothetical protein